MFKILTAIAEENILEKIIGNRIVKNKNILYREAILDSLKKNKNIDTIIISEKIPGDIDFIKLIKKIKNLNKKINIIIILSNRKIEKELIKINIKEIYYNNIFSIHKLIKKLKKDEKGNKFIIRNNNKNKLIIIKIINKIKEYIYPNQKNKIENKNNIICIYGNDEINEKIIELIIIKRLLIRNKKIININLKINNKKRNNIKNKKMIKLDRRKNKYYLKLKSDYQLKEKKINRSIIKILNIDKILKNKNNLIKIEILKRIIKKYNKKNFCVILSIIYKNKDIKMKKLDIKNKNINIIVAENNKKNLLILNENKNKKINLIIINYEKKELSKYFYKIILKNKFNKIKIIN